MSNNFLNPYEQYKETGLFWLNKIPMHWDWLYLSQVSSQQQIKNTNNQINNVLSLSYGNIIKKKNIDFGLVPKEYNNYQIVSIGNIILRLTDLQNDKRSLRTGLVKEEGIITSAYVCLKINKQNNPSFVHYLLHSFDNLKVFYGMGGGVRQSIGFNDIRKLRLPIPPIDEQNQIVKYLDHKLENINKFIKSKKRLIVALKEQKQAVINEAVTKGLNPNTKMKSSGIEWLGDIPQHWEEKSLSQLSRVILSGLDKKSYENQKSVLLCNYVDVYKNDYITKEIDFMKATASDEEIKNLTLLKGDIIITKDSESWDDIAVPSYVAEELKNVLCAYHLAIIRTKDESINPEFLYSAFLSQYVSVQYKLKAKGVTRYGLSYQSIRDIKIFVPPLYEQEEIINLIRKTMKNVDKAIQKIQSEIDLISEYRNSLILDVVTGKVDVQGIDIDYAQEDNINIKDINKDTIELVEVIEGEECEV